MRLSTRKLLDRSFTACAVLAVALLTAFLLFVLTPIFVRGSGAYVFKGTVEYRRMMFDQFGRGNENNLKREIAAVSKIRQPVYQAITAFEKELDEMPRVRRKDLKPVFKVIREETAMLLGPEPGKPLPVLPCTVWDGVNTGGFSIGFEFDSHIDSCQSGQKVKGLMQRS